MNLKYMSLNFINKLQEKHFHHILIICDVPVLFNIGILGDNYITHDSK